MTDKSPFARRGFFSLQVLFRVADANLAIEDGTTSLMMAALHGHTEVVKILIGASADVNAETDNGSTALIAATEGGHTEIADILKRAGARR
ncbi:MAG: ankyrin repeat domain-containing protein [Proteobacteria bacterium]|nr:ankyrin repeat domain-containing protein [Pseudomonadota bacterium]